jgi:hypothetical protein
MRGSPVYSFSLASYGAPFLLAVLLVAIGPACLPGSKCCDAPPGSTPAANVCDSASFTACVHACGESDTTESTAATCAAGVYSCDNSTIPAVSCPSNGWSAALACGPWVSGHDCGLQCGVCIKGLWTCAPCPDAATD